MTTKINKIETNTINFSYISSPETGLTNLGYIVKRPRITKTGGIIPSTIIGNLTIGIKGVYSVTVNIQARLTSTVVPQMYWTNPSIGNIGFGSLLGNGALDRYCELCSSFIVNNLGIYTLPVTIIIPASQTGLLTQLFLDIHYIRLG